MKAVIKNVKSKPSLIMSLIVLGLYLMWFMDLFGNRT